MKINHFILLISLVLISCCKQQKTTQNSSPMEENIRPHQRVGKSNCEGEHIEIKDVFEKPAILFIPEHLQYQDTVDIVFHFHGSAEVIEYAACQKNRKLITVTINLGSGSSKYERPLQNNDAFPSLLEKVNHIVKTHDFVADQIIISGFSAGYGAVRAILNNTEYAEQIDAVLLLDGLHTDYKPDGLTLYQGGELNADKLFPFLQFAGLAAQGEKKMLITHSSIFPGSYASTTECIEYMIGGLNLTRNPVLLHGPVGMQQVGTTDKGNLHIWAFAGNTAPDHMDHLHGFHQFITSVIQ